jgi:hypothetical protein
VLRSSGNSSSGSSNRSRRCRGRRPRMRRPLRLLGSRLPLHRSRRQRSHSRGRQPTHPCQPRPLASWAG